LVHEVPAGLDLSSTRLRVRFFDDKGRQSEISLSWTDLAPEHALTTLSADKSVDPNNRLVAASLEAEWDAKLRALSEAGQNYERRCLAALFKVDAAQRERILGLATDFPRLWNEPDTAVRFRGGVS
jgi:hypothetical protein